MLFRLVLASRLRLSLSSCVEAVSLYDSLHHNLIIPTLLDILDSATHRNGHGAASTRLGRVGTREGQSEVEDAGSSIKEGRFL